MFLLQALGSNGSGQLGIGHKDDVSTPQPAILPASLTPDAVTEQHPVHIAAGGNHTLLLLSSGTLLWTGDATSGACGPIPTPSSETTSPPQFRPFDLAPVLLEEEKEGEEKDRHTTKVTHIAATWEASILVTTTTTTSNSSPKPPSCKVYTLGRGPKGELGLGPTTLTADSPTPILDFPPPGTHIVDLASCMGHAVAVLSNGEAWGWGNARKGQLGEPAATAGAVWSPRRIDAAVGFRVARAVCGREFTCLFGPPETGQIAVLGSDKWGVRSGAPGPERLAGWKQVGAGWGSVYVLRKVGKVVSWGRDDHGQLARDDELGRVRTIAVGSEHALALTEDGGLMAWGWGEHGNCGPIREQRNGERGQRNRIASSEQGAEITLIGAGCATSWFVIEKPT